MARIGAKRGHETDRTRSGGARRHAHRGGPFRHVGGGPHDAGDRHRGASVNRESAHRRVRADEPCPIRCPQRLGRPRQALARAGDAQRDVARSQVWPTSSRSRCDLAPRCCCLQPRSCPTRRRLWSRPKGSRRARSRVRSTSPPGCSFHSRCPERGDHCAELDPEMREIAPGHVIRCNQRLNAGGE